MTETPEARCEWLVFQNRSVLLRDKDWDKIFEDIMDNPGSYARYYPMVRVKIMEDGNADRVDRAPYFHYDKPYVFLRDVDVEPIVLESEDVFDR